MKKGCFLTIVVLLTVLISSGIYLYKKYGYKLEDYGKEKIMDITLNKLNEKLSKMDEGIYNDSLKLFIETKTEDLKKQNFEIAMNRFQSMIDYVKIIIEDNKVDSIEFNNLKKLTIENERSKKNRN
ncbi:MAG: hypothetical protein QHH13_05570 [Melioribacter sp.]|uniref:hypothetical protein n=1 Tax=Rosettibacter primus TaxID=3111523 RepID=UPI00247E4F28|nr:hypothetical protein [Melioribacter sp.]